MNNIKNKFIVYALTDENGQVRYVGRSIRGTKRPKQHGAPSNLGRDRSTHKSRWIMSMQKRGLKYGYVILSELPTIEDMYQAEKYWISFMISLMGDSLTNATMGGEREMRRNPISEETRERLSKSHLGKPNPRKGLKVWSEEQRRAIGDKQRGIKKGPQSEETKAKLSAIHMGMTHSEETKAVIREKRKLQKMKPVTQETRDKIGAGHRGRKVSKEAKLKMSLAKLGKKKNEQQLATCREAARKRRGQPVSDETREKLRLANTGRGHSEEVRQRMSVAKTGRKLSEETKRKMSVAQKNRQRRVAEQNLLMSNKESVN